MGYDLYSVTVVVSFIVFRRVIDGSIVYNFTALDLALDMLYENRLK